AYILQLLDRKIKLFELVVGELDLILGEFGGAHTFEGRLADEWLASENEEDFARRLEAIGADIEKSSAVGKEQEQLTSDIAQVDRLPLFLADIEADAELPGAPSPSLSPSLGASLLCRRRTRSATAIRSPTRASGRCSSATAGSLV